MDHSHLNLPNWVTIFNDYTTDKIAHDKTMLISFKIRRRMYTIAFE